jgi:Copper chaperone
MTDTAAADDPRSHSGDDGDRETLSLSVPSMDCPSCAGKVESSVSDLNGVSDIDPRTTSGTLVVGYDADRTTPEAIREAVGAAGYEIEDGDEPHDPTAVWKSSRAIKTASAACSCSPVSPSNGLSRSKPDADDRPRC